MTLENVKSERESETFADFTWSQITFYLVTHNETRETSNFAKTEFKFSHLSHQEFH